jgi:hypothetical protein
VSIGDVIARIRAWLKIRVPPSRLDRELDRLDEYYIDHDGWLHGPNVFVLPSARWSKVTSHLDDGSFGLRAWVWHWSSGNSRPGQTERLARAIVKYSKTWQASWTLMGSKQGAIWQSCSFRQGAWHVSPRYYTGKRPVPPDTPLGIKFGSGATHAVNLSAAGYELENAGKLKKINGIWRCWPYTPQKGYTLKRITIEPERVVEHKGRHYDEFTEPQVVAAAGALGAFVRWANVPVNHTGYQHRMFEPDRRDDAGDLFVDEHLPIIQSAVYG